MSDILVAGIITASATILSAILQISYKKTTDKKERDWFKIKFNKWFWVSFSSILVIGFLLYFIIKKPFSHSDYSWSGHWVTTELVNSETLSYGALTIKQEENNIYGFCFNADIQYIYLEGKLDKGKFIGEWFNTITETRGAFELERKNEFEFTGIFESNNIWKNWNGELFDNLLTHTVHLEGGYPSIAIRDFELKAEDFNRINNGFNKEYSHTLIGEIKNNTKVFLVQELQNSYKVIFPIDGYLKIGYVSKKLMQKDVLKKISF